MRKVLFLSLAILLLLAGMMTGAAAQEGGEETPEATEAPVSTEVPESTAVAPDATETPASSQPVPDATEAPASTETPDDGTATAYVRVVHLARETDGVDLYVNGQPSGLDTMTFQVITGWVAVPAGEHTLTVVAAGGELSDPLLETTLSFFAEEFTTIVVADGDDEAGITVIAVVENFDEMLPGTGRVTFLNAMSDGSVVNFNLNGIAYVTSLGAIGDTADGRDAYLSIPMDSGPYDFTVNVTGETENLVDPLQGAVRDDEVSLLVVVGTADAPTLLLYETTSAQAELVRGNLIPPGTITEAVQSNAILLPFYELMVQAEIANVLNFEGPYTIFAPADYLLVDFGESFGDDIGLLQTILGHHVVLGDYKFSDLVAMGDGATLMTVTGQTLVIGFSESSVTINGAEIVVENIPSINGTIHVINQILTADDSAVKDPSEDADTASTAEPPAATETTDG